MPVSSKGSELHCSRMGNLWQVQPLPPGHCLRQGTSRSWSWWKLTPLDTVKITSERFSQLQKAIEQDRLSRAYLKQFKGPAVRSNFKYLRWSWRKLTHWTQLRLQVKGFLNCKRPPNSTEEHHSDWMARGERTSSIAHPKPLEFSRGTNPA